MKRHHKIIIASLISLFGMMGLTGCSSLLSSRMPAGSISMKQAYGNAINGSDGTPNAGTLNQVRAKINPLKKRAPDYRGHTQTEENEIDPQFPQLPNPSIVLYVYPHEVGSGDSVVPVPGYSTIFPLYQHVYYAMPGEIDTH